jgi:heptosyltransferase-2
MPRSFKAALIPWLAGVPVRTGFRGEARFFLINDARPFDRNVLDQTVKRFVALGLDAGEALPPDLPNPSLRVSTTHQARALDGLDLDRSRPVIAMMPGAEYGPAKCWPLEYFAQLAARLDAAGYAVWIFGSHKDAAAGDRIAEGSQALNLCGRTSLEEVIDLLAACEQAVSNDSGLLHIAAAVGIRVHGIYGSSSPKFTPPLTKSREIHEIDLECRPCFERECPLGHLRCLRDLEPDAIFEKIIAKTA